MNVTKCDKCGKKIIGDPVTAGLGYFRHKDFCDKCGKPIINFLKKNKLIDKEK